MQSDGAGGTADRCCAEAGETLSQGADPRVETVMALGRTLSRVARSDRQRLTLR